MHLRLPINRLVTESLDPQEKITFHSHLLYQSMDGIILGILAMNEFVFLKSIRGSSYELGFLLQFAALVFLFLVLFVEIRKRIRNKRRMLRLTGLVTRIPLMAMLFFPADAASYRDSQVFHIIFLGIFLIYYLGNAIIYPSINVLLKTNYRHENFGKLYAYTSSLNKLIMLVVTFAYGMLLDYDFYVFRYVFPVAAILGITSIFILTRIDDSKMIFIPGSEPVFLSIRKSIRNNLRILLVNKPFRDFEIGFMLYGFAYMTTEPVINLFLYEGMQLNYSSVAFYKNAYNIIAIVLLLFTGRWIGRMDPRKFAALTFLSLLFYIFFMIMALYYPAYFYLGNIRVYYMLILSYAAYGYFAGTMVLVWNIGSAYFCKPEEADDYQSNHLFLTGVRAIFAPLMGVWMFNLIGFTGTFSIAIGFLILSISTMFVSARRQA